MRLTVFTRAGIGSLFDSKRVVAVNSHEPNSTGLAWAEVCVNRPVFRAHEWTLERAAHEISCS